MENYAGWVGLPKKFGTPTATRINVLQQKIYLTFERKWQHH